MKTKLFASLALVAVIAAGCAVGPDYKKPAVTTPSQWSEPVSGGETNLSPTLAGWWKQFNDPELNSLVDRAVSSNLDLQIAEARVREARAVQGFAAADLWPTVHASGDYSRQRMSANGPFIGNLPLPAGFPLENNVYEAGFDASWELDVFGGKRRSLESARAEVAAAEFGRRDALVTLLGDVARNYVEMRGYQRRLSIAHENIKAQEEALAITRNRFTNGLTSDLDVQQAASLLATTRAAVPSLETSVHASVHRLGVLLGQDPGALSAELSQVAPIPASPPEVPVGLPSELLRRRPDIQQAERQLASASARVGVATADLFPKFYLTGSAGLQSISASDFFNSASKLWSVGPTVEWKIFDAGRVRATIRGENAREEQALAIYRKTVLTSFEDVENALVAYGREQARRQSLADAVSSSADSLHLANQLYQNGLTDFLNVLDAERSLYQAQDQLADSERTISTDLISLYKALGGGWEMETRTAMVDTGAAK